MRFVYRNIGHSNMAGRWANMVITTDDILINLQDLKVLGKGDFKSLLKWRTALREEVWFCSLAPGVATYMCDKAWPGWEDGRRGSDAA